MKLQNLIIIFIIIILPIVAVMSAYINYDIRTIEMQSMYNSGIVSAMHDTIYAFETDTQDNGLSKDPEQKKSVLKSCAKVFQNSFSNTCNIEFYGNEILEKYIPAMMFGMYDGFYLYAPYNTVNGYKHELRNYVYYTEVIPGTDITIRYSLDNYMVVSGTFGGDYITKAGYWIALNNNGKYKNREYIIDNGEHMPLYKTYDIHTHRIVEVSGEVSGDAKIYLEEAEQFSNWFNDNVKNAGTQVYLKNTIDPEDENSPFVEHKRHVMQDKIQSVLNTSITSYAKNSGINYKMPKLLEEDWQKIYSDISFVTFVQGMNLGFKKYNGYCVMNSSNHNEYVNPEKMYFIYEDDNGDTEYHSIKCDKIKNRLTNGYKIGDFRKTNIDIIDETDASKTKRGYFFKFDATACYGCINGNNNLPKIDNNKNIYSYVTNTNSFRVKKSYFTSLARERHEMQKVYDRLNLLKE